VAHHVVGILQPWQVGGVGPAATEESHTGFTCGQGLLYLLTPFASAKTRHVTKHPLSAKSDSQPVPHPSAGTAGMIPVVADDNAVAFSSKTGTHDSPQQRL
jgi:hypothetical protein